MACQLTTNPNQGGSIATDVDQTRSDSENLDTHMAEVESQIASGATRVSTTWPGGAGIATNKRPNQTMEQFLDNHKSDVLAALAADPIDCP